MSLVSGEAGHLDSVILPVPLMASEEQWKPSIFFLGNAVLQKKSLWFLIPAFYPFIAHNFQEQVGVETYGKI